MMKNDINVSFHAYPTTLSPSYHIKLAGSNEVMHDSDGERVDEHTLVRKPLFVQEVRTRPEYLQMQWMRKQELRRHARQEKEQSKSAKRLYHKETMPSESHLYAKVQSPANPASTRPSWLILLVDLS